MHMVGIHFPRAASILALLLLSACPPFLSRVSAQPYPPVLVSPEDQSGQQPTGQTLTVLVTHPDQQPLTVTFHGRRKPGPADEFTIVGLPDTQYYTGQKNGGSPDIFYSQTQWIADNMLAENIVFVSQLGDCVENGDAVEDEWKAADTAMLKIEDPVSTALDDGIPYGIAVGNHDQSPFGDPDGTTAMYNAYFGEARFLGRNYYGGHFGDDNDNHYQLFSAGGMDFITIHLEYDPDAGQDVLDWADQLLATYSDRRAIIVSHFIIGVYTGIVFFGTQGQAIYNQFKDNANVFLMLCGHVPGEGHRTDTHLGNTIHSLLSDYQSRLSGGSGWLRLMKFKPATSTIEVRTYSPWLNAWETDEDSQFTLDYDMTEAGFEQIGTVTGVVSGETATVSWPDLSANTEYEWYALVDDGSEPVKGPVWSFTTGDHLLEARIFLEGSFASDAMNGALGPTIPMEQPYFQAPWNYPGTESLASVPEGMEDWVLLELRDASSPEIAGESTTVARFAGLLMTDGQILDMNGELPRFSQDPDKGLFLVIRHRNHLDIISAYTLINTGGTFSIDLTAGPDQVHGGEDGIKALGTDSWGMIAGDLDADGQVDDDDVAAWQSASGQRGYLLQDANLDLQGSNPDKNDLWLINRGRSSQVPD